MSATTARDRQRTRRLVVHVEAEGEGHRGEARQLADDEAPAGEVAPEASELLAAVDVRSARRRVDGGELGGRVALRSATMPAIASPIRRPEPAACAAGAQAEKTPAPIIEPSPITTASPETEPAREPRRRVAI